MTKSNIALAALLVAAVAIVVFEGRQNRQLNSDNAALHDQISQLQASNTALQQQAPVAAAPDETQTRELARLRGEVARLTSQIAAPQPRKPAPTPPPPPQSAEANQIDQQQQLTMNKMNYNKQWLLALLLYSGDNRDTFPTNFDAALKYLPASAQSVPSLTQEQFDLLYSGPVRGITNPSQAIVIREKAATQLTDGRWQKVFGFADGHVEVQYQDSADFSAWENQHIQPPAGGQ